MARAGRGYPNRARIGKAVLLPAVLIDGDSPAALRQFGPDGDFALGIVLIDTPLALRQGGPVGSLAIGIDLTDSPSLLRSSGLEGSADLGVSIDGDLPSGVRAYGPDGLVAVDLSVTDRPGALRSGGISGNPAVGIILSDTPLTVRFYGPEGSVLTDVPGGLDLTDAPLGIQHYGSDGYLALSVVLDGDLPKGIRPSGPDGSNTIGLDVSGDSPAGIKFAGPSGLLDVTAGGTDVASALRNYGPTGSMGVDFPLVGDRTSASRLFGPAGLLVVGVGADVILFDIAISGLAPSPNLTPSPNLVPQAPVSNARQIRISGPVGEVLLAVLQSKPPYIPLTPLVAPNYALWIADTRTGRMLWELPAESFTWDQKLNDIGTIRATLSIESFQDSLSDQDERDPRILIREILTGPWRFSLVVRWGNNTVWAGPYLSMNRPRPDKVEMNGAEIGKLLSKRVLIKPGASAATDVSADTIIGPYTTKQHAAAVLISQAITGTGNNLPITVTDPGGGGTDYRTYYGYDLSNYWEKLLALSTEVDGPEIRFDPKVTAGVDGDFLSWTAQIGTPHLGRSTTTWVFDSDVNSIVGFDGDGSNMSLGVWSAGSGQSRDKLVVHTTDTSLLNIGWPMIEAVDSSHSSETVYPVLAAQSAAALSAYKSPIISFHTAVPADSDPMVGTYRVGEDFAIDIHGDPIIPDGFYTRRIAGLSGSEKPWVTIIDTSPLPVGSI
jgi:hypothetical protein